VAAEVGPVANTRSIARRAVLVAATFVALLLGAGALYVFINLDEAKSVQTTAEAARICKRALSATTDVTCMAMLTDSPRDPWGREYLCEKTETSHIRITSLGGDGRPRGQAADADVVCEPSPKSNQTRCGCRIITD
jgi:hypothetical protein